MKKQSLLLTCFLLATQLTACGSLEPWTVWRGDAYRGTTEGALNVGGERPPVLTKYKGAVNPYDNHYTYAFTDSDGQKINVFDSLLRNLDAYSEQIDPLKPWITKRGTTEFSQGQEYPFKMFLLTISPEIVLVVPTQKNKSADTCSTLFLQGCLLSQVFRGNSYWFRGAPQVAKGSYWFSLADRQGTIHQFDSSRDVVEIKVEQAILKLTKTGDEWHVDRVQ